MLLNDEQKLKPNLDMVRDLYPMPWDYDKPIPKDQLANPVLFQDRFAIVRFENTTGKPLLLYCYSIPQWPVTEEGRTVDKTDLLLIPEERKRERHQRILEESWVPSLRDVALVEIELRDHEGNEIRANTMHHSLHYLFIRSSETLINNHFPVFVFQPGETVDIPMPILGKLKNRRVGLKPGTYTVRAIVSYAEAPSGERKQVMSEPIKITVTEEHIKAAEAYWAGREKK